ncbi:hypothetical protein P5673_031910 [Acropora cervicornis]|uniref:Uncharacterized protein n=1 Tax=Acropora cervicornis TaxID=6130 RepID=A0AAD9USE1_ACRCE|nr:hypothetical protein P5673_031910 [Acropora cervicornis]
MSGVRSLPNCKQLSAKTYLRPMGTAWYPAQPLQRCVQYSCFGQDRMVPNDLLGKCACFSRTTNEEQLYLRETTNYCHNTGSKLSLSSSSSTLKDNAEDGLGHSPCSFFRCTLVFRHLVSLEY